MEIAVKIVLPKAKLSQEQAMKEAETHQEENVSICLATPKNQLVTTQLARSVEKSQEL